MNDENDENSKLDIYTIDLSLGAKAERKQSFGERVSRVLRKSSFGKKIIEWRFFSSKMKEKHFGKKEGLIKDF